jgi:chondroitin 4-sulfotransferase 11
MPVSDKYKLIFIHIPKNAGTAITNTLDMYDIGHHGWQYYKSKYPQKWEQYKKISVIRNPWDRVVSCYEYAKMEESYWHSKEGKSKAGKHLDYDLLKDKSFGECLDILKNKPQMLRHQGWSNQSNYIYNNNHLMVDYVLDVSEINDRLSEILNQKINIPKINVSNQNNYKNYYIDNDMISFVKEYYKKDINNFNYNF